jgi:hypothetical protein
MEPERCSHTLVLYKSFNLGRKYLKDYIGRLIMCDKLLTCVCGSEVFIIKIFDEVVSIKLGEPEYPEHSNNPSAHIITIEEVPNEFVVICKFCGQEPSLTSEIKIAICYR